MDSEKLKQAAKWIIDSNYTVAFTGAGISVESGIPPFRGKNGIWNRYEPKIFDLDYFLSHPVEDWKLIYEVFYETIFSAKPNNAHIILAQMEQEGLLHSIITQNIDNLHFDAGSKVVREFHGNTRNMVCVECGKIHSVRDWDFSNIPPRCECGGLLKPDFVFFGEPIPQKVFEESMYDAQRSDVMIVIGTTGVIYPASKIPHTAKQNGAKIIEININHSEYTPTITDLYIEGKASEVFKEIFNILQEMKK